MKLVVAAGGALVVSALILFACVGDDAPPASPPEQLDGSSAETGGGTDAPSDVTSDAPPPRLKCAVQNNPIPAQLGSFQFDSGNGAIDAERFTMVPLADKNTVAVAAIVHSSTSSTAGAVAFWTINANQGAPSPQTVATLDVVGTRLLWVGRLTDGVGALVFGPAGDAGGFGWFVYKLSDADLLAAGTKPVTAWTLVSEPVPMVDPTFDNSQSGAVIPLDQNDYFIVGTVAKGGTSEAKLVTARLSSSIKSLHETTLANATVFPGSIIPSGGSIHVFLATGDFGTNLTPFHYTFDRGTANENGPRAALPNDLLIASTVWSGGTALFFGDGDFATGKASQLRIGSVANLDTLDPSKLPVVPISLADLGVGHGGDVRFWSAGLTKPIVLALGPRQDGPGVGFQYIDVDGNVRANQAAAGADALLQDVKAPSIVAATATSVVLPPSSASATFPLVWVVRGGGADTLFYSRILCQ